VRFAKLGKVRWTSHRDVARMWERAFRRVGLPVAYSGGFAPRPKVSFGLALPTGCESVAEYLDVDLTGEVDVAVLPARLSAALPDGVDVVDAGVVDGRAESLQQEVTSCGWWVLVDGDAGGAVAGVLGAPSLPLARERKGRPVVDDVRPAVLSLAAAGDDSLLFELATQPRGVRPTEVLAAWRPELEVRLARRTHQWIERDGARCEPLPGPPATTAAPHAEARAS
jgi:radical SAM-linked protein